MTSPDEGRPSGRARVGTGSLLVRPHEWVTTLATARYAAGVASSADVARAAASVTDHAGLARHLADEGLELLFVRAMTESGGFASLGSAAPAFITRSAALATRSLAQFRQLADLVAAFADAGVTALPYKGPLLSWRLYGDAALRSSTDLDIVVERDEYERARAVLVARGLAPRRGHTRAQERSLFRWLGHASFGTGDATFVELHWRFAPHKFPYALSPRDAIARSRSVQVAGRSLRMMSDLDLVVTLAMHATMHVVERLEWLAGFARAFTRIDAPAADLLAHAGRLHGRRMLLVAVATAHAVLELPLDAAWTTAVAADEAAKRIAALLALDAWVSSGFFPETVSCIF